MEFTELNYESKLPNELEHGGIYGMTYDTYIEQTYKHRGGRRLTSVGLAQARPN